MKTSFGHFAAWRLALRTPPFVRAPTDMDEQHRWDGEGGNAGVGAAQRRHAAKSRRWGRKLH
jgi:hypothetical protein